jgi:2'-5' RNA ligase
LNGAVFESASAVQPLILTLKLDDNSFQRLDALRKEHFPRNRNVLDAHLTLFHALPAEKEAEVRAVLDEICAQTPILKLEFPKLRSLGKGMAVEVDCEPLEALRRELSSRFRLFLGPQDAQRIRPHVTICNKVTPDAARALFASLSKSWQPFEGRGEGLSLWRYLGGPWEGVAQWNFQLMTGE